MRQCTNCLFTVREKSCNDVRIIVSSASSISSSSGWYYGSDRMNMHTHIERTKNRFQRTKDHHRAGSAVGRHWAKKYAHLWRGSVADEYSGKRVVVGVYWWLMGVCPVLELLAMETVWNNLGSILLWTWMIKARCARENSARRPLTWSSLLRWKGTTSSQRPRRYNYLE